MFLEQLKLRKNIKKISCEVKVRNCEVKKGILSEILINKRRKALSKA